MHVGNCDCKTPAMGYVDILANLMSPGGLAIAIGIMAHGAIVMAENVDGLLHETEPDEPRHRTVARAWSGRSCSALPLS